MKKQLLLSIIFVLSVCFVLTSCEKNNWFNSSSKTTRNLENDWTMVLIPCCHKETNSAGDTIIVANPAQHWNFKEGKMQIIMYDSLGNLPRQTDQGSYSLDVALTDITLTLSDLEATVPEEAKQHLNGKWTIVSIDGSTMVMAHQIDGSGLLEKEFTK